MRCAFESSSFTDRSGGEDLGEELLLRPGRVRGADRADAGQKHFGAVRWPDNDFNASKGTLATFQIHRQPVERFGVAGGCGVGEGYLTQAWFLP